MPTSSFESSGASVQFALVTLFPEMFKALTDCGVSGRAFERQLAQISYFNPRDFTQDKHRTVDDRPYGGGPGMLMMAEPLCSAIQAARKSLAGPTKVLYLSPQGKPLNQSLIEQLAKERHLVLIAGRYEGINLSV